MAFYEVIKCVILECETLIFAAIAHSSNQPVDEDDEFPTNIWIVVGDMGCESAALRCLISNTQFSFLVRRSVCKEIMDTMF